MKTPNRRFAPWFSTILLAACGGGDNGSVGGGPPGGGGEQAVITSENATVIAGDVAEAARAGGVFGTLIEQGPVPAASAAQLTLARSMTDLAGVEAGEQALAIARARLPSAAAQVGPETVECQVAGTITISGDIADPQTLTAGDRLRIDFAGCDDGDGTVIDGAFEMLITRFAGDLASGIVDLAMSLSLEAFQVVSDEGTSSADGDVEVDLDTTASPISVVTISAPSLSAGVDGVTQALRNYVATITADESVFPTVSTFDSRGTFTSSRFDGDVTFDTVLPFQAIGEDFPFTGELLITGADDASITLIALDNVNVRLEIDFDGDGAVDETIDTTWQALRD